MFNLRYIFRLIGAFFSRFKALILLSVLLGVIFFFFLRYALPFLTESQSTRIGITGRYTLSTLPVSILNMIGNGLTKLDANGTVEPDLASSWETPDKVKTWTFIFKDNLFWQDEKKVLSKRIFYQLLDVSIDLPAYQTITLKPHNP